jgi:hypothetical protein
MIRSKILLSTAGGGKTTKLIERVREVNGRILIISFTRVACDEIFHRSEVKAYTLHSFCMKIMKKNYILMTNIEDIVKIFNETEIPNNVAVDLISRYSQDTKFNPPEHLPDVYKYNKEFIDLFNKIQEEKRKHNIYFFSDILYEFYENIEEFLPIIYDKYDHILIDEAQDLSELQWKIIYKIITSCFNEFDKSFFVAGDRKQVIYDFQGSNQALYDYYISLLMNLNSDILVENSTQTYRFGGEIAKMVTKEFELHESQIPHGEVILHNTQKDKMVICVKDLILGLLNQYAKEDILVLYPRQNYLISELQENLLTLGSKLKVYLQGNMIVEALWDLLNYSINHNPYYKVRVLHGPFLYLSEPNGHYLITSPQFKNYHWCFFEAIDRLCSNAEELLYFLMSRKVYCTQLNALVLNEICKLAYGSLAETLNRLPEFVYLEQPGIRFSSIHGAKGTESKVVIYIRDALIPVSMTVNKDYFVMHNKIYVPMLSTLDYVAKTRATERLYIINI